ncbi:hypothetical protein ID866_9762 [Astraeus odoratus]|nr:hypothetical protein ID866_9762 [Astraeus odoratus]
MFAEYIVRFVVIDPSRSVTRDRPTETANLPNHLGIPFKKAYATSVRASVRDYILGQTEDHPDAYRADIAHLRPRYHAQLVFIVAKLPSDVGPTRSAHQPRDRLLPRVRAPPSIPVTLRSLAFERAAVLFNLATLYSQRAAAEDRAN